MEKKNRRAFIQTASAVAATAALEKGTRAAQTAAGLPKRPLGKTGAEVSILALGGWHIGYVAAKDKPLAVKIMHRAIDEGMTFFDNAWDYHNGGSEEVMGEALAADGKRKQVFLMTKNCERDYEGSMKCLEDSLRRLKTDHIDLWQFHEMVYDNDPDWVFEKGGIKAAIEAKKAGKVRFIGFTGHKDPQIHLKMLGKPHPWDACQMPINAMDAFYRSFQKQVVPVCTRKKVGVIGMKSLGGGLGGNILKKRKDLPPEDLIRYSLGQPIASLVIGIDSMEVLDKNLAIARSFKPMSAAEREALLAKVKDEAGDGRHELFKSSKDFDGPHHRKQHGFG